MTFCERGMGGEMCPGENMKPAWIIQAMLAGYRACRIAPGRAEE